jgi:hypothetical protein
MKLFNTTSTGFAVTRKWHVRITRQALAQLEWSVLLWLFLFLHSLAWKGPIKNPIKNLMINNVKSVLTPNPQIAACDRPKYDMIMQGNRLYGRGTIYRPWRPYISWDKIIYIVRGRLTWPVKRDSRDGVKKRHYSVMILGPKGSKHLAPPHS